MSTPEAAPKRRGLLLAIVAAMFVVGYGLDQLTKYLVVTHMQVGEIIWVIHPVLKWYSIRNSGAAFSIGEDFTWVFTVFMAVVAIGVLVSLRKLGSTRWSLALGGLLAGTLGNLTDRLFQPPSFGMGHVVDFISIGNFAIFNIADSLIVCSVISIVALLWFGVSFDGSEHAEEDAADAKATDAA